MQTAPARYRRADLPDFDCRDRGGGKNQRHPWVEALPHLGFERVFDQAFITLESQLSWQHDINSLRAHAARKQPQKLWIQVWRHEAGALSNIVRFSDGADQWSYSSVNLLADVSHGFCSTYALRGSRTRADGSVAVRIEGDDHQLRMSLEDSWGLIQQMAAQGRLMPLEEWDVMPLPNELLEAVAPGWHLHWSPDAKIDTPAARYNTKAEKVSAHGVELLALWARRMEEMPKAIPAAERSLWLEQMQARVEIAFKQCTTPVETRKESDPAMQALVDRINLRQAMKPHEYRRGVLMNSLQEKLTGLLMDGGMIEGDVLEAQERATTLAWIAAIAGDCQDDPAAKIARAIDLDLPRFALRFESLLFAAARTEGVAEKIKVWIQQQPDYDLALACTSPDKNGATLPMHLGRAWMEAINTRHYPEEEHARIAVIRECFGLLAAVCPIDQWSWANEKASVWDWAPGHAINLPHDDDLVAPHQERLTSFCDWLRKAGANIPTTIFMQGHAGPLELLDVGRLARVMDEGISRGDLNRRGSPAQRMDLMAPLTVFLVHMNMQEQVTAVDGRGPTRAGMRF